MDRKYSDMHDGDDSTDEIRKAIKGWTIVNVGMTTGAEYIKDGKPNGSAWVEGGLTLILERNGKKRKVILGYTELGEWLEHVENIKETK